MSSFTDKLKGLFNRGSGKVKQATGEAVGNDRLRAKGAAQEVKGNIQETVGAAKSSVKKTADEIAKAAHKNL